ncbi:unnamed protein product [Adineta steineri]|uniref:Uncharacterized protein n=1 Tax=Adineta steineri TaxID=433720 RepID=A0A813XAK1_9BILA|nr:unnamed protein product [Adineta steineri]
MKLMFFPVTMIEEFPHVLLYYNFTQLMIDLIYHSTERRDIREKEKNKELTSLHVNFHDNDNDDDDEDDD